MKARNNHGFEKWEVFMPMNIWSEMKSQMEESQRRQMLSVTKDHS